MIYLLHNQKFLFSHIGLGQHFLIQTNQYEIL
ncbi:MAG TPA: hypothetical protein [Caudoviricetes sp.]|nr:MAG TPA: hypothetical protein [Caudoviricetes sp.]